MALGRGAGFRQSLGVDVIGGISLSLLLTLFVVQCAYLLFDNFTNWLGRRVWHNDVPAEALAYTSQDGNGPRSGAGGNGHLPPGSSNGHGDGHKTGPTPNPTQDTPLTSERDAVD